MKTIYLIIILGILGFDASSQTTTQTQRINARATGYAIVAARNPGIDFSIYLIPWDGVHSLEENAQQQINPAWHAQAAVKGNYFYQDFEGSSFSKYSSVVVSQAMFDKYKDTGTDWWIVCSTLPPFSESISTKESLGVGTKSPKAQLHVSSGKGNEGIYPPTEPASGLHYSVQPYDVAYFERNDNSLVGPSIFLKGIYEETSYSGRIVLEGKGNAKSDMVFYTSTPIGYRQQEVLRLGAEGNVGIGTVPGSSYKLAVKGRMGCSEVVVESVDQWPDYVFEPDYAMPSLKEVDAFVKRNRHLPGVPSQQTVAERGIEVGNMQAVLLEKVEELTLYTIRQQETIDSLVLQNSALEQSKEEAHKMRKRMETLEQRLLILEKHLKQEE